MDPIRTAVKYSLIPLRTVVEIGEAFVDSGDEPPAPTRVPPRPTAAKPKPRKPAETKPKQTDEVATPIGEPAPADLARERKGRQPAPFGSSGSGS